MNQTLGQYVDLKDCVRLGGRQVPYLRMDQARKPESCVFLSKNCFAGPACGFLHRGFCDQKPFYAEVKTEGADCSLGLSSCSTGLHNSRASGNLRMNFNGQELGERLAGEGQKNIEDL